MKISSKADILRVLAIQKKDITHLLEQMSDSDYQQDREGKWSVLENVEHLIRSTNPVIIALKLPKTLPQVLFGKKNRTSKTYEEIVNAYKSKLSVGAKASFPYTPKPFFSKEKKIGIQKISKCIGSLEKAIRNWSEDDLEKYQIPHPIIGKITFKEMLYFVIYHFGHHSKTIENLTK